MYVRMYVCILQAGKFPFVAQKLIVLQKASLMGFGRPKVLATPEVTKKLKVCCCDHNSEYNMEYLNWSAILTSLYEFDCPFVCLNVSCLIFWSAFLEKCMENGQ